MIIALTSLHVLIAVFLILIVLVQSGKGSDIGAAFGGGASQTVFGARGATTVLHKITSGLAVAFMATSLVLAVLAGQRTSRSVIPDEPAKPAAPASSAPAPAGAPAGAPAAEQKAPPGGPPAVAPGAPTGTAGPGKAPPPAPPAEPTKR